jgi:uncharacterized protein YdcH (DUF465 family)
MVRRSTKLGTQNDEEGVEMEQVQDELKAHLMATNEEFRQLVAQHADLKRQVEAIEAKPHVTPEDEVEEHRIKKLKLRLKDQINEFMAHHKQQVA